LSALYSDSEQAKSLCLSATHGLHFHVYGLFLRPKAPRRRPLPPNGLACQSISSRNRIGLASNPSEATPLGVSHFGSEDFPLGGGRSPWAPALCSIDLGGLTGVSLVAYRRISRVERGRPNRSLRPVVLLTGLLLGSHRAPSLALALDAPRDGRAPKPPQLLAGSRIWSARASPPRKTNLPFFCTVGNLL